jgi:hypothetical protein
LYWTGLDLVFYWFNDVNFHKINLCHTWFIFNTFELLFFLEHFWLCSIYCLTFAGWFEFWTLKVDWRSIEGWGWRLKVDGDYCITVTPYHIWANFLFMNTLMCRGVQVCEVNSEFSVAFFT